MDLTVESLIGDPLLRTRIVAGSSGLDRAVAWAHTCEVPDPWNWLGSGDLLMTDGYGFPAEPQAQVSFIRELAAANIAGLALGEGFAAPPLTQEAIDTAEELGFPVLMTARSVPFVTIARVVAEATNGRGNGRAARVLRLYDILRRSHRAPTSGGLLAELGDELDADLHVIDLTYGRELMPVRRPLSEAVRSAALERVRAQDGRLPAFNRLTEGGMSVLLLPVGTSDSAGLVVREKQGRDAPDLIVAQHAAMIVELEVERRAAKASRARERGTVLARRMLDGNIGPEAASAQLRAHRLGTGPWRVTAWSGGASQSTANGTLTNPLTDALEFVPWPHLYLCAAETHLVMLEDSVYQEGLKLDHLEMSMGASQPLSSPTRFSDAVREARWALEGAVAAGEATAVYGARGSYFMPRTVAEGEVAVRQLLGPILDYDEAHDAQLLRSLQVYFEVNRSWQEGSRRLDVHKQTLVYRIRKIEELTGVDLRDFGVQAELYMALKTWRLLHAT
ncbi:PucR family transcriptional regulator [Nocardioides caldifontis]|uniref:PucR family transcriptional regulator n=1 Tax=Nocardioides caldifontis TaxID=2588938 RepID=UPI0011DF739F|nr:PucR family transcriptional regulator [Nocardioides caldifontis]